MPKDDRPRRKVRFRDTTPETYNVYVQARARGAFYILLELARARDVPVNEVVNDAMVEYAEKHRGDL